MKKYVFLSLLLFFNLAFTKVQLPTEDQLQMPTSPTEEQLFPPKMPVSPTEEQLSPQNINSLLKDIDWEQVANELKEIFPTDDPEDLNAPEKQALDIPTTIEPQTTTKVESQTEQLKIITKKLSLKENFLLPAKPDIKSDAKQDTKVQETTLVKKLDADKNKAFDYYWKDIIKTIQNIETKIGSFNLGIAFKEELEDLKGKDGKKISYKVLIDQIEKDYGLLSSRKFYLKIFYLPVFNKQRENIFNLWEKLKEIEPKLEDIKNVNISQNKKNLKELISKDLYQVSIDLDSIICSTHSKNVIETKKKERDQAILKADAKKRSSSRSDYLGSQKNYPYSGSSRPERSRGQGDYYPDYSSYYSPTPESYYYPTEKTPTIKTPKKDSTEPSEGSLHDHDKTEKEKIRTGKDSDKKSAKNKILDIYKDIQKIFDEITKEINESKNKKEGAESLYKTILSKKYCHKINRKLEDIEKERKDVFDSKENKEEIEKAEKQFTESVDKFVPTAVRVIKEPFEEKSKETKEQGECEELIKDSKKLPEEAQKYQDEILKSNKIKNILEKYDLNESEIKELTRSLQILFKEPQGDKKALEEIKKLFNDNLQDRKAILDYYRKLKVPQEQERAQEQEQSQEEEQEQEAQEGQQEEEQAQPGEEQEEPQQKQKLQAPELKNKAFRGEFSKESKKIQNAIKEHESRVRLGAVQTSPLDIKIQELDNIIKKLEEIRKYLN